MAKLSKYIGSSFNAGKPTLDGCYVEENSSGKKLSEIAIDFTAPFIDDSSSEVAKNFSYQGNSTFRRCIQPVRKQRYLKRNDPGRYSAKAKVFEREGRKQAGFAKLPSKNYEKLENFTSRQLTTNKKPLTNAENSLRRSRTKTMSETGKLRKSKTLKDKKSISWFNFERIFKFRRKTPNSLQKSTEKLPLSESTNTTPSKPKREAQFEVKNETETQPQSNENADSRNYFKEIETPQTSSAGVTRPPRPSHNSQSKTSWSVQLRDRVGPRPSRPESSKPFLSEDARNYSSQLNLRCSMPILNPEGLTFSCFPREMAVDVGFAKAENDRWKRHSIAVTFQEPESQNTATMVVSPATEPDPVLKTRSKSTKSATRPTSSVIPSDIPEEANLNSPLLQRDCLINRKMSKSVQAVDSENFPQMTSDGVLQSQKPLRASSKIERLKAEALWDYKSYDPEELSFSVGDTIEIIERCDSNWWWASSEIDIGWVPAPFLRLKINQKESKRLSNNTTIREKVLHELLQSERDYVRHLRGVINGYLITCENKKEFFSEDDLLLIFGNLKEIMVFQQNFLQKLETAFEQEQSVEHIANAFLENADSFEIYSVYCNNHPAACAKLKSLMELVQYRIFFETCRLKQKMIEIDICGFLLTPVQKICKYPLQLSELLKSLPPADKNYDVVAKAKHKMEQIALLINERKRRFEEQSKITRWQANCRKWKGPDIIQNSSMLVRSGAAILSFQNRREQLHRHAFLFNHQIVLVKQDRADCVTLRERIDLRYALEAPSSKGITMIIEDNDGLETAQITLSFKRDHLKWATLINAEIVNSRKARATPNFHIIDKDRPRSTVMREWKNRDSLKQNWKRTSLSNFVKGLSSFDSAQLDEDPQIT